MPRLGPQLERVLMRLLQQVDLLIAFLFSKMEVITFYIISNSFIRNILVAGRLKSSFSASPVVWKAWITCTDSIADPFLTSYDTIRKKADLWLQT